MRGALRPLLLALMLPWAAHAGPGELTVLSVESMKGALGEAIGNFEKASGLTVAVHYAKPSQLKAKLHAGEHPDIVVAPQDAIAAIGGGVQSDRTVLGRVGVGVAVAKAAKAPDVSSPDAFKKALSDAKSVMVADPSENADGDKARKVLEQAGLAEAVKPKLQLGSGSNPLGPVGFGNVELGLNSIQQILETPDLQLAAAVPSSLQQWTRIELALVDDPPNPSEARQLLQFLNSSAAKSSFAKRGIEAAP